MAIARPSYKELVDQIYAKVRAETGLTANLDSSVIGAIVKVIAAEFDLIWASVEELERKSNLTTAQGSDLDSWGMLFGVMRKSALPASTTGMTRAIRMINNGVAPAIIPQGTRVYKDSDPELAFFTSEGATIPAGNSADLHVTAAGIGEFYNVGIGEINRHSVPGVSVTVTNILPIQNGASQESDGSYRARIIQELTRRDVLNRENVVSLMRAVPGVRDAILLDLARGHGTFDIVVIPYNLGSTNAIIQECTSLLEDAIPAGLSGKVRAPRYRKLAIQINLTFSRDTQNRDAIRQAIREQISARIDNLPIEDGSGAGAFGTGQILAIAQLQDQGVQAANIRLGLDGSPISSNGTINLGIGERIILEALSVE